MRHLLGRHVQIDDLVDEGRVGAVFQKPPHQIGQKIAMRADRCIDPAAGAFGFQHDVMQPLAHPVQALKLVRLARLRHVEDGGDRMGIVGGELRIDPVGHRQQLAGIGDIADVGRLFAGKDRKVGQAQHLRALDLGVPIGALDQPHHDLAVQPDGHVMQPVDDRPRPAAIGLHDDAEPRPPGQLGVAQHRLDHTQRQGQPVRLFGVDVKAHAGAGRLAGQIADHGDQFGHDAGLLGHLIARVQG